MRLTALAGNILLTFHFCPQNRERYSLHSPRFTESLRESLSKSRCSGQTSTAEVASQAYSSSWSHCRHCNRIACSAGTAEAINATDASRRVARRRCRNSRNSGSQAPRRTCSALSACSFEAADRSFTRRGEASRYASGCADTRSVSSQATRWCRGFRSGICGRRLLRLLSSRLVLLPRRLQLLLLKLLHKVGALHLLRRHLCLLLSSHPVPLPRQPRLLHLKLRHQRVERLRFLRHQPPLSRNLSPMVLRPSRCP
ncbi:MAG: hypothetical protein RLZZ408_1369, partial [Verrucomicrobiota bacterium]